MVSQSKAKFKIKKGDTVLVIAGKDKGKTGIVRKILTDRHRVIVEGINMVKKSVKANPMLGQRGGHIEIEAPLHISNVMYYDLKADQPTRLRVEMIDSPEGSVRRVRASRKTGEHVDV